MRLFDSGTTIVYVNLDHRIDRRIEIEKQLSTLGLTAIRQAGIPASKIRSRWGFKTSERYACSLAKRLAIRRGFQNGARIVVLLEDDVVFHDSFFEILGRITLPEDWGMFFLGCRHGKKPSIISRHLLKCSKAVDNHALCIHRPYFRNIMRGLSGLSKQAEPTIRYSDSKLAGTQNCIPTFAAIPNLVWQKHNFSDTSHISLSNYDASGYQISQRDALIRLYSEMRLLYP